MKDHYNINVRTSGTPIGTGYYLKTTKVTDTFDILNLLQPYQAELPDFMYKLSWENRLDAEMNHYKQTHPDYTTASQSLQDLIVMTKSRH